MRKIAFIAVFVMAAIFTSISGPSANAQAPKKEKEKVMVTVKNGDTLSKISKAHDTTYVRIYNANKSIKHPDVIHPGQKFRIPSKDEKLAKRPMPEDAKPEPKPVASAPVQRAPKRQAAPSGGSNFAAGDSVWDRLAACESGGNWAINTGNGYYGGLQFSLSSWRGVGGSGYPHQASRSEQIARGEMLRANGGWGHWPACSAKLGLR